ncbi:fused phosphoenolpyruvate-protein phosphotransferase PtsP/GAF domain [Serratia rubidaea]|uniref:Fused phosphoenolpyruvate-protein phosphotransferase PtsP/GAF domain n=1 Tax=Serratia rubidaea TaxID=61652 RepID=A0A4U9HQ01_SERRU|nr:fused phosphoenolpyruvate-protein phosphotransferase PtsP/GAF domain [Serratia rubidaea]
MKGWWAGGSRAELINLADAQSHPSFKYIPQVKEEHFRSFLGVPIIHRRQLFGVLVVQQRDLRQFNESEESFMVTLATQMAGILSQSQLNALFGPLPADAHPRAGGLAGRGGR